MKMNAVVITIFVVLSSFQMHAQRAPERSACCSIVEQALASVDNIKPGMTRADIEKNFVMDGGLDFGLTSIYTYKECPLIKIRVDFSTGTPGGGSDSPKDIVKSVSKPYLEYPTKD